jgi:hypothetical protein
MPASNEGDHHPRCLINKACFPLCVHSELYPLCVAFKITEEEIAGIEREKDY